MVGVCDSTPALNLISSTITVSTVAGMNPAVVGMTTVSMTSAMLRSVEIAFRIIPD